jgi:phosphohistidine phosphatase
MVNLVIMRHGDAEPLQNQDSQRQLTGRGQADVSQMALWLSRQYPGFDRVFCSPYLRTCQTAELMVTQQGQIAQFEILPELVPEGDSHQVQLYLDALWADQPHGRFLLISHMPLVSFLVETFTRGAAAPIFETSGLVCLDYQPGQAARLLERMAPQDLVLAGLS